VKLFTIPVIYVGYKLVTVPVIYVGYKPFFTRK